MRKFLPAALLATLAGAAGAQELAFPRLDKNKDGYIDKREFSAVYASEYFAELDRNGDGRIEPAEVDRGNGVEAQREASTAIGASAPQANTGISRQSFERHDRNGDNRISMEEARAGDLVPIAEQFDSWDADASGYLDQAEYDNATANFGAYDVNADGEVSEDEVANNEFIITNYALWDSNGDGLLDRVEFERGLAAVGNPDDTNEDDANEGDENPYNENNNER